METIFLKDYLANVGKTIHSLNTICVGLSHVSNGTAKKPNDLVISWNPKNVKQSSIISRTFAIKSAYVFLAEATYQYMDYVKSVFILEEKMKNYHEKSNAEKIDLLFKIVENKNENYRNVMLKLLVHTRNRIVHKKSNAKLSVLEEKHLVNSSSLIKKNHSGLNINDTLDHFEKDIFTLKDVSSHAANTIYLIRKIDQLFIDKLNNKKHILDLIQKYGINNEWEKILKLEFSDTKKRKLNHFLELYFGYINEEIRQEIIKEYV